MEEIDLFVIGGSAGALEPLMQVLECLPPALTMPIAVVMHVTPRQPSLMSALLARSTRRAVREAEDKEPLERNTVYVAPPNYHMLIERKRTIALSVDEPVHFSRPSIDVLFESAAVLGGGVAALVLSGANSDGAEGLARIADAGGLALVQSIDSAAHTTMPAAALERVPTAYAVTPREVPEVLARRAGLSLGAVLP